MFATLSGTKKAVDFSVLVWGQAAALAIMSVGMASGLSASALYMSIPAEAALIMMIVATSRSPISPSNGGKPRTPWTLDKHPC